MLRDYLHTIIKEDDISDEINYIKDGYSSEIDKLRQTAFHSDQLLLQYQQELIQDT
jgi:DNA mismatch repair ATPase MutS